jgi:hypothetical protein
MKQSVLPNIANNPSRRYILWRIFSSFARYFKWILLFGIFAFKFFEWWYASEDRIRRQEKLPVPPPPEPLKVIFSPTTLTKI